MNHSVEQIENQGQFVVDLLDRFKLFWNVKKEKLYTGEGIESNYYSIRREDTNQEFFAAKEGYEVFQNWELIDMVAKIAQQSDLSLAKGGSFHGGRKVYLKIDTGSIEGIGENNDQIKKYITVLNSHDGTGSLALGMTNITMSCSNTFHRMYKEMNTRIRHSANMRDKVDLLMRGVDKIREQEQTLYEKFYRMAEKKSTANETIRMVQAITGVNIETDVSDAKKLYSPNQIKKAQKLTTRIVEEQAQKGETLWGLFSGVTSYTTKDVSNRRNDMWENKMTGSAYKADNKAFDMIDKITVY
jgi:hypothetical protein